METKITTITDAKTVINNWTESYDPSCNDLSDESITRAARKLVEHVGGYGEILTEELSKSFDLDAALAE